MSQSDTRRDDGESQNEEWEAMLVGGDGANHRTPPLSSDNKVVVKDDHNNNNKDRHSSPHASEFQEYTLPDDEERETKQQVQATTTTTTLQPHGSSSQRFFASLTTTRSEHGGLDRGPIHHDKNDDIITSRTHVLPSSPAPTPPPPAPPPSSITNKPHHNRSTITWNKTYSTYRAGDVTAPVSSDKVLSKRIKTLASVPVELSALRILTAMRKNKGEFQNIDEEQELISFACSCRYSCFCCTLEDRTSLMLAIVQCTIGLGFFFVAAYFGTVDVNYEWVGVQFWRFMVLFGVGMIAPVVAELVVRLFSESLRYLAHRHVRNRIEVFGNSSARNHHVHSIRSTMDQDDASAVAPPPATAAVHPASTITVQQSRLMNLSYFVDSLKEPIVRTLYMLLILITFALCFGTVIPQDDVHWQAAYTYTLATLGALDVYFVGTLVTRYITLLISREVNVTTLGNKIRGTLKGELILWKLMGARPLGPFAKVLGDFSNEHLIDDPRTARKLASAVRQCEMRASFAGNRQVYLKTDQDGRLMGALLFRMVLESSLRNDGDRHHHMTGGDDDDDDSRHAAEPLSYRLSSQGGGGGGGPSELMSDSPEMPLLRPHVVPMIPPFHGVGGGGGSDGNTDQSPPSFPPTRKKSRLIAFLEPNLGSRTPRLVALDLAKSRRVKQWDKLTLASWHMLNGNRNMGVIHRSPRRVINAKDVTTMLGTRKSTVMILQALDIPLQHAWTFLDPEDTGFTSLRRVRNTLMDLVRTRRNLSKTLEDAKAIVRKLQSVVAGGVNFFVGLCVIAIYGLNVLEIWVGISSIVLAFSFVFGGSLKNLFDSVVFLFGVHPYDVGDAVKVGPSETKYWVRKISLLSTTMLRWDGAVIKMINATLLNTNIINVRQSGNYETTFDFLVDGASMPSRLELEQMTAELELFLAKNRQAFTGECSITVREILDNFKVRITIWVAFGFSEMDAGRIYREKSRLIQVLIHIFKRRGVKSTGGGIGTVDFSHGNLVNINALMRE